MSKHSPILVAGPLCLGLVALSVPACAAPDHEPRTVAAGAWRLNPAKCPDLVEDRRDRRESRRDERRTYSRADRREDIRDRRESRRDEAVTVCPRSAWEWRGAGRASSRPAAVTIYFDDVGYYRYTNGRRVAVVFG